MQGPKLVVTAVFYIEADLRDEVIEAYAARGIAELEQMLARYAEFNRLYPER